MNKAKILAVMLKMPQWHLDHDTVEERTALLDPLAQVISEKAKSYEEAAALIAHSNTETGYARLVLTGHCDQMPEGVRCDNGRARGPFQVHAFCVEAWKHPDGTIESYRGAADCILRSLRFGFRRCHTWSGAFSGLRGAPVCTWERAARYVDAQNRAIVLFGKVSHQP